MNWFSTSRMEALCFGEPSFAARPIPTISLRQQPLAETGGINRADKVFGAAAV
jgi:hypothetical protein